MNVSSFRLFWLYLRGAAWWTAVVFATLGTILIFVGYWIWRSESDFRKHAVQAVARVVGKDREKRKTKDKTETIHLLIYRFRDASGREFEGKAGAQFDDWQRVKEGDSLTIEYAENDPSTNRKAGIDAHAGEGFLILGGFGVLFGSLGYLLAGYLVFGSARRIRIVRTGVATLGTVGEVVECDAAVKVRGTYCLTYAFTDVEGAYREGRGPAQPWSLAARWDPGETILVLYDPRNPDRNEADIWEVRPDDLDRLQE